MKQLHKSNLFGWSEFNQERNIDFHSVLWTREQGNVLIDPLPLSDHDFEHLISLGGASIIVITNSDHIRDAENIAKLTQAKIYAPIGEKENFPLSFAHWVSDQQEIVSGLLAYQLEGSKTPGELAFILEGETLITGDLIRCHIAGELCLLPTAKLTNPSLAIQSLSRLAQLKNIKAVLTGDGWPLFSNGNNALENLLRNVQKV